MEPIRTHTYWMSMKEYYKRFKKNTSKINLSATNYSDNTKTRTHIFFTP